MKKKKVIKVIVVVVVAIILYGAGFYNSYNVAMSIADDLETNVHSGLWSSSLSQYDDACDIHMTVSAEPKVNLLLNIFVDCQVILDTKYEDYNLSSTLTCGGLLNGYKTSEDNITQFTLDLIGTPKYQQALANMEKHKQSKLISDKMNSYTDEEKKAIEIAKDKLSKKLGGTNLSFDNSSLKVSHYNSYDRNRPNRINIDVAFTKGETAYYGEVSIDFNKDFSKYKISDCMIYQY